MANDKLMNHTQGETIITKLTAIADSLDDLAAVSPAKFGMGYAVTNTPADTVAKTANIANFVLTEGAPVNVKFTYANTATNATLNLNNTGAKPILYKGSPIGSDIISAGDTCEFIYSSANGGSYNIINIDALSGAGAGTVKSVGASAGLKTDQTGGAAINITGSIKLDLKSETPFEGSAANPQELANKIYPVALDADGHPAVSVPGADYTQGAGINISDNNVITNTGVFDITTPTSSDTSATDGDIKVTKKVVNSGVTSESVTFVKPKGINDPAYKALDSSSSGLTADDAHVPTSKAVQDAIDEALASASIYQGTIAAFNDLPTSTATVIVRKGWYYRVSTAWSATTGTPATHVGDIIISEKDSPSKSIDGTNWSLLHNEANTDANVTQSPVATNADYEVLFSGTADNTAHTEGTGKDTGIKFNPSTDKLTVSGEISGAGFTGDGVKTSFASQTSDLSDKKVPSEKLVKTSLDAKVAGPSSVTGDTIVLFDSTTGKLVKSSSKTFESSYAISDDDNKVPTSKGIRENAATYGKLGTYSADTSRTNITDTTTIKGAVKQLEYREELNKSNILSVQNKVGKNLLNPYTPDVTNYDTSRGITYTNNKDGTWYVAGTSTQNDAYIDLYNNQTVLPWGLKTGDTVKVTTNSTKVNVAIVPYTSSGYGSTVAGNASTVGTLTLTSDIKGLLVRFQVGVSGTVTNENIIGMVCHEGAWNQNSDIELYGAPNYDLTRLEAEDRASLAEVVDSGAKNILEITIDKLKSWNTGSGYTWNENSVTTSTGVTFTLNSDGSISTSGTASANSNLIIYNPSSNTTYNKQMVISGCPDGGNYDTKYAIYVANNQASTIVSTANSSGSNIPVNTAFKFIAILVRSGTNVNGLTFKPMICTKAAFGVSQKFVPFGNNPFYQVPINHNMIYRGQNLGATLTDAQHTALSSGNFTDLYLGDYWTKTVTIPAGTYTGGDGEEVTVAAQTNITLKAVIADFDTFYGGYNSSYAIINTHHAAVIVTGFSNVVWNKTNSTAGGYVASLIHKWLVGSVLPQMETWFGSAKVLSHQKLLTNAITGDAASGWDWSSQKIALLSENQMYGSKVWGGSKATNGAYEPGEAHKHLNVFNHIAPNMLFGNKNIWCRDIASAAWSAGLNRGGYADYGGASNSWVAPAALILLS